jgi:cytochrome d ubiquinol oxidase subunit I
VLVVAANAWMQVPVGFTFKDGKAVDVSATAPFESPVWGAMSVHSTLACFIAVGFAVAGVYAVGMLRGRRDDYHRAALDISMAVAAVAAVLQLVSGDASAKIVARLEPTKLAAAESHFETSRGAPILIGGIPDPQTESVRWGIKVPKGLSILATGDPDGEVKGLREVPPEERPNVIITHLAFQVMVGCGFALIGVGALYWLFRWRKKHDGKWPLRMLAIAAPLGFLALEAGWIVTEVGRQPWIVKGIMRTSQAVTPASSVDASFFAFSLLYLGLGAALVFLLRYLARKDKA